MFCCFLIHCVHMCCTYIYYNYCNPTTLKACFCIVFLNMYLLFHHFKQTCTVKKKICAWLEQFYCPRYKLQFFLKPYLIMKSLQHSLYIYCIRCWFAMLTTIVNVSWPFQYYSTYLQSSFYYYLKSPDVILTYLLSDATQKHSCNYKKNNLVISKAFHFQDTQPLSCGPSVHEEKPSC